MEHRDVIIAGLTTLNSTIDSGMFTCPRCNSPQPFRVVGGNQGQAARRPGCLESQDAGLNASGVAAM